MFVSISIQTPNFYILYFRDFAAGAFIKTDLEPFVHTSTAESPRPGDSHPAGRRLAQGHLDTQLGGAGDRTSDLPVTRQPALPPELLSPPPFD